MQPLCGGYDSLSLDPPDHHFIHLHIRAGRFDGSGEGFAMPFITEADLAALARYPLSLQQAARALGNRRTEDPFRSRASLGSINSKDRKERTLKLPDGSLQVRFLSGRPG